MAAKKTAPVKYIIKVKDNSEYCGIGAGSVQFAHGTAETDSARMAEWFKEHKGYEVEEVMPEESPKE